MTIATAREILGQEIAHLSDDEVAKMNNETALLCSDYLKFLISHPIKKPVIDMTKN